MEYKSIYVDGIKISHFHYNEGEEKLEAYDEFGRIIADYDMTSEQWSELDKLSYAACWEELGVLFGDPEENN